jgi:hypothetical protein
LRCRQAQERLLAVKAQEADGEAHHGVQQECGREDDAALGLQAPEDGQDG